MSKRKRSAACPEGTSSGDVGGPRGKRGRIAREPGSASSESDYFGRTNLPGAATPARVRSATLDQPNTAPTSARKLANLKAVAHFQEVPAVSAHASTGHKAYESKRACCPALPPEPHAVGNRAPRAAGVASATRPAGAEYAKRLRTTKSEAADVEHVPTVMSPAIHPTIALPGSSKITSKRKPRSSSGSGTPAVTRPGRKPKVAIEVSPSVVIQTAKEKVALEDVGLPLHIGTQKAGSSSKAATRTRSRKENSAAGSCPTLGTTSSAAGRPTRRNKAKARQLVQPIKQEEPRSVSRQQSDDSSDGDSNEEWEEVEELIGEDQLIKSQLPSKPVEVLLDVPDIPGLSKRKKKTFDIHAYLRRKWKKFKKDLHENTHKVHLLCFLSYGLQLNRICNSPMLHAVAMSACGQDAVNFQNVTLSSLKQLVHWFNTKMSIPEGASDTRESYLPLHDLESELLNDLSTNTKRTRLRCAVIFLLLLRSQGTAARLVFAARPIPWKMAELKKEKSRQESQQPSGTLITPAVAASASKHGGKAPRLKGKQPKQKTSAAKAGGAKRAVSAASSSAEAGELASGSRGIGNGGSQSRRSCTVGKSYSEDKENFSDADDDDPLGDAKSTKNEAVGRIVTRIAADGAAESDDDFCTSPTVANSNPVLKKRRASARSSDECLEMWIEVYVDPPGKWICLDLEEEVLDTSSHHEAKANRPFTYVLSFDNDGCVKDVTQRYASEWMSGTQKLRADEEWWAETLAPYRTTNHARDKSENAQLQSALEKRPFPTSVAEFKGHPLYALKRHLLKFEAIYPESAVPLGYIKGEAIYARECIHTLHSRETWLKEAKSVRIGEKPYKMVKPRPKMNKPDEHKGGATLGVYGSWQVEDYQPPVASGGKVPRNEYGNVELFKPCMLPIGCVHLPMPALHRVAKKLNIDVAPAMVGWEGYCGYSVPQFDGWVVCEEHKDVLLSAWEQYEAEERRKQHEKKEKRILGNWVLLVRGLLIKEKLKGRFDLCVENGAEPSSANSEKAADIDKAWPRNMKPATTAATNKNGSELFPFEQI